jgi:hypothetical protein
MPRTTIDRLIINSPYEEPQRHWRYDRETRLFDLVEGRRPAGYVVASPDSRAFDDPGIFVEIPLVNQIRPRVKAWREAGYPGVSSITKRLLEHWRDPEEFDTRRFFFCQLEAVETLIWLVEAPAAERVGIEIPGDGGEFVRQCCKMATGSGKTIVMAMVIAWQVLNKVASPQDARFSKNVLVIAPGLTVKKRLAVLELSAEGMLSEGWDAKTVTHIMGLRAFTSQLLCEQVVGRGLRRTSYEVNPETGLFEPEYVNIFGVPFTFLPHEGGEDGPPPPPTPKTAVEPDPAKAQFEIHWPNVLRIERVFQPTLTLDWSKARPLELDAAQTAQVAELAPILEGKPDVTKIDRIELERLAREFRTQRIIFETARDVFDQMKHTWQGSREVLLAQLVRIVEQFIRSDRISISPPLFYQDELRRRLIITLNMSRVVQHVWEAVRQENTERLTPVFDRDHPIRSTGEMRTWYTGKPCERTRRSHINVCVYDSTWEASDAFVLDDSDAVAAWVKNDHLGFEVLYVYRGVVRKYRPDFIVRLKNGDYLVLETKGQDTEQDRVKCRYLDEWVQGVSAHGGFGHW